MNGKKVFIALIIVLISLSGLFAQNPDEVSRMLETQEVTVGQVGYFLAVYLELVPDVANGRASLDALQTAGYGTFRNVDAPISLSELAGLCMKVWKIEGGLMYSLFKSNHYAFREFQSKGYISFSEDPMSHVSGYRALNLIYKCLDSEEDVSPSGSAPVSAAPATTEPAVTEEAAPAVEPETTEPVLESEAEPVAEPVAGEPADVSQENSGE